MDVPLSFAKVSVKGEGTMRCIVILGLIQNLGVMAVIPRGSGNPQGGCYATIIEDLTRNPREAGQANNKITQPISPLS